MVKHIPITVYETVVAATEPLECSFNILHPVILTNIGGVLYRVYTINNVTEERV